MDMRVREACDAIGAMLARCGAGGAMVCQPTRRGATLWRKSLHVQDRAKLVPPAITAMATSAVGRGAAYELACLRTLNSWLGMQLYRTGGAGDCGVDLRGWWSPGPVGADEYRVLVQCKAEKRRVGPVIVRELEGTLLRAGWVEQRTQVAPVPLFAILASASGFSKQSLLHMRASPLPMLLLHLGVDVAQAEMPEVLSCQGFVWNDALAGRHGLLRGDYEAVWHTRIKEPPVLTLYRGSVRLF